MEALIVGIREFRYKLATYLLESDTGMPGIFCTVELIKTGTREVGYGTGEEAYGRADRESAAAD